MYIYLGIGNAELRRIVYFRLQGQILVDVHFGGDGERWSSTTEEEKSKQSMSGRTVTRPHPLDHVVNDADSQIRTIVVDLSPCF